MDKILKKLMLSMVALLSLTMAGCLGAQLRKDNIYEVTETITVAPGHQNTASAQCNDPDDVILTGICQSPRPEVTYRSFGGSNITYNSQPTSKSGWFCTAFNPTSSDVIVRATVACLPAPG